MPSDCFSGILPFFSLAGSTSEAVSSTVPESCPTVWSWSILNAQIWQLEPDLRAQQLGAKSLPAQQCSPLNCFGYKKSLNKIHQLLGFFSAFRFCKSQGLVGHLGSAFLTITAQFVLQLFGAYCFFKQFSIIQKDCVHVNKFNFRCSFDRD